MQKTYQDLLEHIRTLPVVDTHEHLFPEALRLTESTDFFTAIMGHYLSTDLFSAGMPQHNLDKLRDKHVPFDEKIPFFLPFWEKTDNTAYCRVIKIAAKDLYGIETFNRETLPELNSRFNEMNKPGIYKTILQEKCRIKYCLWDQFYTDKPEKDDFFRLSLRLDDIVLINSSDEIQALEKKYNMSIKTPETLESIMEVAITAHKPRGLTALKCALAYARTLDFTPVSKPEAILVMDKILRNRFSEQDAKTLQDYLMYSLAQKCGWHGLPLQFHTGILEGNGSQIMNTNPALLTDLIIHNPGTRFDIFHAGYPFGGEMAAMAKMFPNVYLDMAWTHIISPAYSQRYLAEWLDTVPVSKILGFGGDYCFAEGTYGHLKIAEENIAQALAVKVNDGIFAMDEAKKYAGMLMFGNADALYS
jgi:hypothetical protein